MQNENFKLPIAILLILPFLNDILYFALFILPFSILLELSILENAEKLKPPIIS